MELGSGEILLILIVALLVYGGRLPEVARSIGKSFGELKRGLTETRDVVTRELDPGIHVDLDEETPPRDTLRRARAPEELAKEDISTPPAAAAEAPPPKPEDEPKDPRTRHEHPN